MRIALGILWLLLVVAPAGCVCVDVGAGAGVSGRLLYRDTMQPAADLFYGGRFLKEGREITSALPGDFGRSLPDGTFGMFLAETGGGVCSPLGIGGLFTDFPAPTRPDQLEILVNRGNCGVIGIQIDLTNESQAEVLFESGSYSIDLKQPVLVEPCNP